MNTKEFRRYSRRFKLSVLRDMYEHDLSYNFTSRKYGILSPRSLHLWEEAFPIDSKSLSLSAEVMKKVESMRTKKEQLASANKSREELLEAENARLKKALAYSELRNEGLMELLKIGREEFGMDLLKKDGAKQ